MSLRYVFALALCASMMSAVRAQDAVAPPSQGDGATADAAASVIPALSVVTVEIRTPVGSKLSKPGDTFPIRLIDPIKDGDRILVPAGTAGAGEVVHAKKAGGSGAGGELVLAARYLDVCGRRLRLRSLNMAPTGQSRTNTANAIGVAGAAFTPIAVVGLLIRGGEVEVAEGAVGVAKTAEPFTIESPAGAAGSGAGCPAR